MRFKALTFGTIALVSGLSSQGPLLAQGVGSVSYGDDSTAVKIVNSTQGSSSVPAPLVSAQSFGAFTFNYALSEDGALVASSRSDVLPVGGLVADISSVAASSGDLEEVAGGQQSSESEASEAESVPEQHVVKAGETLWIIAAQYGKSWVELARFNSISNPARIYPGQIIALSDTSEDVVSAAPPSNSASALTERVHIVQRGETLADIARRAGKDWRDLAHWNGIADANRVYAGQQILLERPAVMPGTSLKQVVTQPQSQPVAPQNAGSSTTQQKVAVPTPAQDVKATPKGNPIQQGVATWYGPGFEGQTTYCGQVYNSGHLTAASNTLPCGSVVTVTNPNNGREVTVTVTDRGGFTHAMDLSRAAFNAIADPQAGVTPVIISQGK